MLLDTATAISDLRPSSASRSREEERIERHDSKRRRVETGQASSSSPLAHRPRSSQASPDRLPLSAFRQPSDGTRETSTPQPQAPSFKSAPRFAPAPTSNFSPLQQSRQLNADTTPTSDPARPRFTAPAKSRLGGLTNPLPHAFSPHKNRRGQERYVSDGWASQVRGWIFDTSTQAAEADAQTAEVIQVEEVVSARGFGGQGSLAVVKGYVIAQSGSEQAAGGTAANLNKHRDILLAGEGAPTGRSTVARDRATLERPRLGFENAADVVEKGSRIRLGPPRWEMPLPQAIPKHSVNDAADSAVQDEKTTWLVCAGWKVLDV